MEQKRRGNIPKWTGIGGLMVRKKPGWVAGLGMGYTLIHSYTLKSKSAYVGKGHKVVSVMDSSSSAAFLTSAIAGKTLSL